MRYGDAVAFRMALEDRLNRQAREASANHDVGRFRKFVAFERLLARMSLIAPDGWVVKGGLALEYRFGARARTTLDLDIATQDLQRNIGELLTAAAILDLGDFFAYEVETIRQLDLEDTAGVQRFTIRSDLAGRRFESLTVDVGVSSDGNEPPATRIATNTLAFAEVDPVSFLVLPLEIHVAEKLHAYTKEYGDRRQNTRVKDLIDLVLISSLSRFEMGSLRSALDSTFGDRQVQTLPVAFPRPGEHWRLPYAQLAREVDLPDDLDDGYRAATLFLNPALAGELPASASWDPMVFAWG